MSALDELLPASFRGVPFQVEDEEPEQGRAIPVHEFPGTNRWATEDHGLKRLSCRVVAYVAGTEGVKLQSYALWAACRADGSAPLILPHAPPVDAFCIEVRRAHRRDKLGYVAFTLSFVGAGEDELGVSPLLLPSMATAAFDNLVGSVGDMLSGLDLS